LGRKAASDCGAASRGWCQFLFHPETDAEFDVGPHLIGYAGGPLRSQQQINALGATYAGNAVQFRLIFRTVGNHLRVLVDDDEEMRVWFVE
jgi:hypothetical protein